MERDTVVVLHTRGRKHTHTQKIYIHHFFYPTYRDLTLCNTVRENRYFCISLDLLYESVSTGRQTYCSILRKSKNTMQSHIKQKQQQY